MQLERWGSSGSGRRSFHFTVLATDTQVQAVGEGVRGWNFDWGSKTRDGIIKRGSTCKKKQFTDAEYRKALSRGNEWQWVGYTDWADEEIEEAMGQYGAWYNLALHNCRNVAEDTMFSIRLPRHQFPVHRAASAPGLFIHINVLVDRARLLSSTEHPSLNDEVSYDDAVEYLQILQFLEPEVDWDEVISLLERCRPSRDLFCPALQRPK